MFLCYYSRFVAVRFVVVSGNVRSLNIYQDEKPVFGCGTPASGPPGVVLH